MAAAGGYAAAAIAAAPERPCDDVQPAELHFQLRAEPAAPELGEVVEFEVQIVNATDGVAQIPLFQLTGAEPVFAIEAQEDSYPQVAFARYRLRAVAPGVATLRLSVNFETAYGCADVPSFVFHPVQSPPYTIVVRGDAVPGTPTPTRTPRPEPPVPLATRARTSATSRRR